MAAPSSVKTLGDQLEVSIHKEAEHRTHAALVNQDVAVFKLLDQTFTKEFGPNHGLTVMMTEEINAMFANIRTATLAKTQENLTRSAVRNLTDSLTTMMGAK